MTHIGPVRLKPRHTIWLGNLVYVAGAVYAVARKRRYR